MKERGNMKTNMLKKKLLKSKNINVRHDENGIIITNRTDETQKLIFLSPIFNQREMLVLSSKGTIIEGGKCIFKIFDRKKRLFEAFDINKKVFYNNAPKLCILTCYIDSKTTVKIESLIVSDEKNVEKKIEENFVEDTLIICPGYPSDSNQYLFGFIHSRVREYFKNKFLTDIAIVSSDNTTQFYEYEGVNVAGITYMQLRELLQRKKYKRIIIHYFKDEYNQILSATDLSYTKVYIFAHGGDLIYRDLNYLSTPYFKNIPHITNEQEIQYQKKDEIIKKYNNNPNVKFIFGTQWAKDRSEKTNNINYNNYDIIPNVINENIFVYKKKNSELRKRIVIIRKFDNIKTYGIDTSVRVIMELSKKSFFKELQFDIYGDGEYHEELLQPIKHFDNVNIYKRFLNHNEISKVHQENGIALFTTRYETQGISALEAALSGLVVLTSNITAVPEVFSDNIDCLFEPENYKDFAKKITEIYENPTLFTNLSEKMHDEALKKYNLKNTINKELTLFRKELKFEKTFIYKKQNKELLLSIIIPSYNVEKYLRNGVLSVIQQKYSNKIEVLIINDGSTDETAKIARILEKETNVGESAIVRHINKENGGHGSTINTGIELAKGKYFKLMDGDDYFDTVELEKLIQTLGNEDSDIILNNYVEDFSIISKLNNVNHYDFMIPGIQYDIEDLCFDNYGFGTWGPLLSTSTFKTDMLKQANFKISEKCFYVDMELNYFAFKAAKTISYYPFNIYIYYLGRPGQSVSQESFKKNYAHHEHVTLKIIEDFFRNTDLSQNKKNYIIKKIILPLVEAQYYIITEYLSNKKVFRNFDKEIKKYSEIYYHPRITTKRITIHRKTFGSLINITKTYVKLKQNFKKIFNFK